MPVKRTESGRIVEEKTQYNREESADQTSLIKRGQTSPAGDGSSSLESSTKKIGDSTRFMRQGTKRAGGSPDSGHTRVLGGRRRVTDDEAVKRRSEQADSMSDPVVGWLVVIDGPGKGNALKLGYGANSVGRDKNERVCLDYGDDQVSRTQHTVITYDPKGRKYYIQHGSGKNLTYLDDQPVLAPTDLPDGAEILLGNTRLKFIPFCGSGFDWQDTE